MERDPLLASPPHNSRFSVCNRFPIWQSVPYPIKYLIYAGTFPIIVLIPWLIRNWTPTGTSSLFGFTLAQWSLLFALLLWLFLVVSVIVQILQDFLQYVTINSSEFIENSQLGIFIVVLKSARFSCTLLFYCLGMLLLFDVFLTAECKYFLQFEGNLPDSATPDYCRLLLLNNVIYMGIAACLGRLFVKWIVLVINRSYQDSAFKDRMIQSRYQLYVTNLLFNGTKALAIRKGLAFKDFYGKSRTINSKPEPNVNTIPNTLAVPGATSEESVKTQTTISEGDLREMISTDTDANHGDPAAFCGSDHNIFSFLKKVFDYFKPKQPSSTSSTSGQYRGHDLDSMILLDFATFQRSFRTTDEKTSNLISSKKLDVLTRPITLEEARLRATFVFDILCAAKNDVYLPDVLDVENKQQSNYLLVADLHKVFPGQSQSAIAEAYRLYDVNGDGEMTRSELQRSFQRIYKIHYDLKKSENSSAEALSALDMLLMILTLAITAMVALVLIFKMDVQSVLALTLSLVLGFNGLAGDITKNLLASLVFLFATHPYDVGDRIRLGEDATGPIYYVRRIDLLQTELVDQNGEPLILFHPAIADKPIRNLRRAITDEQPWETLDVTLSASNLSMTQLHLLRTELTQFLKYRASTFFYASFDMENPRHSKADACPEWYTLRVRVKAKPTPDGLRCADRRYLLRVFLLETLSKLRIDHYPKGPTESLVSFSSELKDLAHNGKFIKETTHISSDQKAIPSLDTRSESIISEEASKELPSVRKRRSRRTSLLEDPVLQKRLSKLPSFQSTEPSPLWITSEAAIDEDAKEEFEMAKDHLHSSSDEEHAGE